MYFAVGCHTLCSRCVDRSHVIGISTDHPFNPTLYLLDGAYQPHVSVLFLWSVYGITVYSLHAWKFG